MSDHAGAVERFNEAFNRHDVNAIMEWMTEECVFENTRPTQTARHHRSAAVAASGKSSFSDRHTPTSDEELITAAIGASSRDLLRVREEPAGTSVRRGFACGSKVRRSCYGG